MNWILYIGLLLFGFQGEIPIKDRDAFIQKFDEISENTSSIQCRYIESKYLSFSKEPLRSEGNMYYEDQKMRWEQTVPKSHVLIIVDDKMKIKENGKIEEHSLASNKIMRGIKEIMVGSMTGNLLKNEQFETSLFENDNYFIVKMIPKPNRLKKMFSEVTLNFDRNTYRMSHVKLLEPGGDYTIYDFIDPVFNKKLDQKLFTLE